MYERTYHDKAIKTDKRVLKREKKRRRRKRIIFIIASILMIISIVFFLRIPGLQVSKVVVDGNQVVDSDDVGEFVEQDLRGNYLWVIPKSNILLVSPSKIEHDVQSHFTRIKTIHVVRTGAHTLGVSVTEYSANFLWCATEENCYDMDEIGVVYSPAPQYSASAFPKVFKGDLQPLPFSPLAKPELDLVNQSESELHALSIAPIAFYFDTPHTLRVTFMHNGVLATLYIDPTFTTEDTMQKLYTGLRTDPLQSMLADSTKVLQYLDLRYSNKVIYKFQ